MDVTDLSDDGTSITCLTPQKTIMAYLEASDPLGDPGSIVLLDVDLPPPDMLVSRLP
jgi:hypothetical protein